MKKWIKIIVATILTILAILIIVLVLFLGWLKSVSPGKTEPIRDSKGKVIEGSIAEIQRMEIGGIKQLVIIRGRSTQNPVLLMLHGGPGSPQAHMNLKYNQELENHFIVVNWDQRGAGGSYSKDTPKESITIDKMVEDTRELSQYLINRFQKEKIFILGHSWGSYLGMRTIHKYPELFQAYIGIGQVSDQRKSEELSYQFVLNKAKETSNQKAIKELEEIGYPENGLYKNKKDGMMAERNWVMYYGGSAWTKTKKDMFPMFILPLLTFREYTVTDKINYLKGISLSQNMLWDPLMNQQLVDVVRKVDVPVYILQGRHDYQTCYDLAKIYFDSLQAPRKEFIEFSNSAHMLPYNLEVEKFHDIMINKILKESIN
jgi:pimeloyl-ACP methyl ester carboxylesterase